MASINKVILIGRLGQDPEIRYTSSGTAVATFSIATNEKWTGKNGKEEERVEWHKIIAWNKLAEICGEYLGKGREVYVEGKIQTRKWDKDGEARYSTEIVAQIIQFLGGGNGGASKGRGSSHDTGPPPLDEDIPF